MHISLDSALGQQRRLNQVGETISSIAAPAAAYSLRSITGGDPKVVRVRRESDNHEQDFTASEVSSGALVDFVNTQVTAPLDIQALTATGRDGDFLIAKAAYSLRSLGTRQATVAATGDTVARANGKYVCQVRSVTGDIKSFTADEVSDGTLVDFVLGNTKSLLNSRAYFDGSNDNVGLTSEINLTGDFSLEYTFVVTEASQQIIGKNAGGSYLRAEGSTEITGFRIQTDGSAATVSLTSNLKYGEANTIKLKRVSGKFGIYDENDNLISAEFTNSDTLTISSFGKARGSFAKGVIYNIRIDTNNDGTINHSYNGYGNSVSDWTDLVGSNNATAVNGSPALFTGQDQDGFVKTWYDQSVTTQAGDTATGNHATQATAASQPKIVSSGSLNTDGGLLFDSSKFDLGSSVSLGSAHSIFAVAKTSTAFSGVLPNFLTNATNGRGIGFYSDAIKDKAIVSDNANNNLTFSSNTNKKILSLTSDASNVNGFQNGTASSDNSKSQTLTNNNFTEIGGGSNFAGTIEEIIVYLSDQTDNRTAIEANMGEHYSISGIPAFDNSVNGFVETWYDQSGNGLDAVQATASKQPLIVESGSLNVDSFSNPTIRFEKDSETHLITTDSTLDPNLEVSAFVVQKDEQVVNQNSGWVAMRKSASSGQRSAFEMAVNNNSLKFRLIYDPLADDTNKNDVLVTVASDGLGTTSIMSGIKTSSGDLDGFFNGSSVIDTTVTDNTDLGSAYGITIGKHTSSTQFADGRLNEVIFYLSDQTANRSAIETNLANHYGITLL